MMLPKKEWRFFILYGREFIVSIIYQRKVDLLMMKTIETLNQSERSIDALKKRGGGCQVLVTPMKAHVMLYISMLGDKHHLANKRPQQFLKATNETQLARSSVLAAVRNPQTCTPYKNASFEEGRPRLKRGTRRHKMRGHGTSSTT